MDNRAEYSTENLDHLGLISSLCRDTDLPGKINKRLHPNGSERIVNSGQSVLALILNGLGYTQRRLYLTDQFFESKPVDLLIGENISSSDLTADTLGKALDDIADYGETQLFSEITGEIALENNLLDGPYRIDTTSLSTEGEYRTDEGEGVIKITQGYSKDHRPDLNQVVLSMVMKGPAELPIHMNALNGNASDKKSFIDSISQVQALKSELTTEKSRWIADSALYSKSNLHQLSQVEWITRVTESLTDAKRLLEKDESDFSWQIYDQNYKLTELCSNYGDVHQRWVLVFSQQSYLREKKTLDRNIEKERHKAEKKAWHLSCQTYGCAQDAEKEANQILSGLKYHKGKVIINPLEKYASKGRPSPGDEVLITGYQLKLVIEQDEQAVAKKLRCKGRFILATNLLNPEEISNGEILEEYKLQQQPERGFRFIKNPEFLVKSIFLKSSRRIQALLMVMTLTLFIYNLGQYNLRKALQEKNESLPNQLKQKTNKPTLRWVFELMQGVSVITINVFSQENQRFVAKMNEIQKKIIDLFGVTAKRTYGFSGDTS